MGSSLCVGERGEMVQEHEADLLRSWDDYFAD